MKSVVYDVTVVGVLFVALARFLVTVSVEQRRPSTKDGQREREDPSLPYLCVTVSREPSWTVLHKPVTELRHEFR